MHTLIVGEPGVGKTKYLLQLAYGRLIAGDNIVLASEMKTQAVKGYIVASGVFGGVSDENFKILLGPPSLEGLYEARGNQSSVIDVLLLDELGSICDPVNHESVKDALALIKSYHTSFVTTTWRKGTDITGAVSSDIHGAMSIADGFERIIKLTRDEGQANNIVNVSCIKDRYKTKFSDFTVRLPF